MLPYSGIPPGEAFQIIDAIESRDKCIDKINKLLDSIKSKYSKLEEENKNLLEQINVKEVNPNNYIQPFSQTPHKKFTNWSEKPTTLVVGCKRPNKYKT